MPRTLATVLHYPPVRVPIHRVPQHQLASYLGIKPQSLSRLRARILKKIAKAYETSLGNRFEIQVSASYKWNNPKTTHELFLNVDNVTNYKTKISEFYDADEPGSVGYVTVFGLFPNLMYRLYF